MKNRVIRLIGIMAAIGVAAGPACSIVTDAADKAVPVSAEVSAAYYVNGLGGAAPVFEEGLFYEEKPLLGRAGAMSCLEEERAAESEQPVTASSQQNADMQQPVEEEPAAVQEEATAEAAFSFASSPFSL